VIFEALGKMKSVGLILCPARGKLCAANRYHSGRCRSFQKLASFHSASSRLHRFDCIQPSL
jgi:hypothetical protein